ncbi:MAG: toll/interleukin-1 receptor domain-containing protein [Pseudomonadota bacterium]
MVDDYKNDLFISYNRIGDTAEWLEKHLVPMLKERLDLELGRDSEVFYDGQLASGGTWPAELGIELGRSRVLLALWSKPFLNSKWCAREVAIMRAREDRLHLRSTANPKGTIAISVIHDGETLPHELSMIQKFEIKEFYNTRMVRGGNLAEGLFQRISEEAVNLAAMIENAPPFQQDWLQEAAEAFFETFYQGERVGQTAPPRFSI